MPEIGERDYHKKEQSDFKQNQNRYTICTVNPSGHLRVNDQNSERSVPYEKNTFDRFTVAPFELPGNVASGGAQLQLPCRR
jgi:hypothetical protein